MLRQHNGLLATSHLSPEEIMAISSLLQ
jgi:hypothetical protein